MANFADEIRLLGTIRSNMLSLCMDIYTIVITTHVVLNLLDCGDAGRYEYIYYPGCSRTPDELSANRICYKKCRSNFDCKGRRRSCLCDGACGMSCVKPNRTCVQVESIRNGSYELDGRARFGVKIHYRCLPGYILMGVTERVCQADRQWSSETPSCETEGKCFEPPLTQFATHNGAVGQKRFSLGTKLWYTCANGYDAEGFTRTMCVGEGRWVGPRMTCSPKRCGHPGEIPNGNREGTTFSYPNRVIYSCHDGYKLMGRPYRVCQANGVWSGELPYCKPVKCRVLSAPLYGFMHGDMMTFESTIRFSCKRGYRLLGSPERSCQSNGEWSGMNGSCVVVDCGRVGLFPLGYVKQESTTFGSIITYKCYGKTTLHGGDSISATCLENGTWSHPPPRCLAQCETPVFLNGVAGGLRVGNLVDHGYKLNVFCNTGYVNDSIQPLCYNGTWSSTPVCIPAPCKSRPRDIKKGIVRLYTSKHGDKAKYSCNPGYEASGNTFLICQYGEWTGVIPNCKPKYCTHPGDIENGKIMLVGVIGNFEYRYYVRKVGHSEMVQYRCDKGYFLIGPSGSTCVDGSWNPPYLPTCAAKQYLRQHFIFRGK